MKSSSRIQRVVALFLLLLITSSLFARRVDKYIDLYIGCSKYFLPTGEQIFINNSQLLAEYDVPYLIQSSYRDSWWYQHHPNAYERNDIEKIPVKKDLVLLSHQLVYLCPDRFRITSAENDEENDFFIHAEETRSYSTKFGNFSLILNEKVFPPSNQGSFTFLNHIQIQSGEKVIDIGAGAGILSIAAAKAGAKVFATDIHHEAIELTRRNAFLNQVSIQTSVGSYFADFNNEQFDVIIANLPQELLPSNYTKKIGKLSETIRGGNKGNEILLSFLDILPKHLSKKNRSYVVVYTGTKYLEILYKICQNFDAKLIATEVVGTKFFVSQYEDYYRELNEKGEIYFFKDKNSWKAVVYVFELRKKLQNT